MADENYREQEQEQEATGIVDAGGFEGDAGTGLAAEEQETAAAAEAPADAETAVSPRPVEAEAGEAPVVAPAKADLHENETGSGLDWAVIVVLLLIVIAGISLSIYTALHPAAPSSEGASQQQGSVAKQVDSEPPFEVAELPEGVAAVVNGEEIPESIIDEYVADFRELQDLQSDEALARWMVSAGHTPESMRNTAISIMVDDELVRQAVDEYGIEATQEQIDEVYHESRDLFDSEEAWQQAVANAGLTEESFMERCVQQAEQQQLMNELAEATYPPEEIDRQTLEYLQQYYPEYADATSLDQIDESKVNPVREMLQMYAKQEAYNTFLENAVQRGDIKMSAAPKDLPYNVNLLPYYFDSMMGQAQGNALSEPIIAGQGEQQQAQDQQ